MMLFQKVGCARSIRADASSVDTAAALARDPVSDVLLAAHSADSPFLTRWLHVYRRMDGML